MNILWILHELTKEADRIAKVGLSDRDVDKTTNKLSIVCQLTLRGVIADIQFKVLVERGSDGLTVSSQT